MSAGTPAPVAATSAPSAAPGRMPVDAFGYGVVQPLIAARAFNGFGAYPAFPAAAIPGLGTADSVVAAVAMRRGQPAAPTSDADIEDFLWDALDLIPGTSEAEVRCEAGRVTLSGSVPHKRQKHDVGEIAWAIPSVTDVQNNVTITARRRARGSGRESDTPSPVRKHA